MASRAIACALRPTWLFLNWPPLPCRVYNYCLLFVFSCGVLKKYNIVILYIYLCVRISISILFLFCAYHNFVAFSFVSIVLFYLCCVAVKVKRLLIFPPLCDLPINNVIYLSHMYYMHIFRTVHATLYLNITHTCVHSFLHYRFYVIFFCSCHASF